MGCRETPVGFYPHNEDDSEPDPDLPFDMRAACAGLHGKGRVNLGLAVALLFALTKGFQEAWFDLAPGE